MRFLVGFKKKFYVVERVVGVLLVATGVAFMTGAMTSMSFWLLETFPALAKLG
jgi:cytochrome c-type biogenesis protein